MNNLSGVASGAGCAVAGPFTTGQYTTGNVILTGSRGGVMKEIKVDTP